MKENLLLQMDQIPPCVARLCAKHEDKPKSLRMIQKHSGLSYRKVCWISRQGTWARIRVWEAMMFAAACNIDILRPGTKMLYLKRAIRNGVYRSIGRVYSKGYTLRQLKRWRAAYERSSR